MTNNVIHIRSFTSLPSIAEMQSLLNEDPLIVHDDLSDHFFLHDMDVLNFQEFNTLIFPIEQINLNPEIETEAYNKHYYLDYSCKRKKGKFKKYK